MAFTPTEMEFLNNTIVSRDAIAKIDDLNQSYYLSPLMYIEDVLGLKLTCTVQDYRLAVEMAHDEDVAPHNASLPVIVDGVLAYIYADVLESAGLDLVSYITYRFTPPSPEFQAKLDRFESIIMEAAK